MGKFHMGGGGQPAAADPYASGPPDLACRCGARSGDRPPQLDLEPAALPRLPGPLGQHRSPHGRARMRLRPAAVLGKAHGRAPIGRQHPHLVEPQADTRKRLPNDNATRLFRQIQRSAGLEATPDRGAPDGAAWARFKRRFSSRDRGLPSMQKLPPPRRGHIAGRRTGTA